MKRGKEGKRGGCRGEGGEERDWEWESERESEKEKESTRACKLPVSGLKEGNTNTDPTDIKGYITTNYTYKFNNNIKWTNLLETQFTKTDTKK